MIKSDSRVKRLVSIFMIITILAALCVTASIPVSAASSGAGLANWALNAYNSNWAYVYGGTSEGAVDCSGLIYTYNGVGGNRVDMLGSSSYSGSVAGGIPNVHGLGLWHPGHVGVYVGGGMAVDARNEYYGVCYESVYGKSWQSWFYVAGVSYPETGWEQVGGEYYYYENGQYITDTSRTIDGVSYYFGSSGASDKTPGDMSSTATKPSDSGSSNSSASSSSEPAAPKAYRNGDQGDEVTKIQQRLYELGFYAGEITGYFGDATEKSYRAFQSAAGVTVDGIAGESDLEILYSDNAPYAETEKQKPTEDETKPANEETTASSVEDEPESYAAPVSYYANGIYDDYIYDIQEKLIDLGYLSGEPTGYFGTLTEQAIKAFQKQNGLDATGIADDETLELMFSDDAKKNPDGMMKVGHTAASPLQGGQEPTTDVIIRNNDLSSKALSGLANDKDYTGVGTGENKAFTTVLWILFIAGILGGITFLVYKNEQSKARARKARAKARAKRYW